MGDSISCCQPSKSVDPYELDGDIHNKNHNRIKNNVPVIPKPNTNLNIIQNVNSNLFNTNNYDDANTNQYEKICQTEGDYDKSKLNTTKQYNLLDVNNTNNNIQNDHRLAKMSFEIQQNQKKHLSNNINTNSQEFENFNLNNNYYGSINHYNNERDYNNINSILKRAKDKLSILKLEILTSPKSIIEKYISIGPLGIINNPSSDHENNDLYFRSLRNKNDGYVLFGFYPEIPLNTINDFIDIQLEPKDEDLNELIKNNNSQNNGTYFMISFNPEINKYNIKDCGIGTGTFIKIQSETLLKNNSLINIGNSYISIQIGFEDESFFPDKGQNNKDYCNNLNIKVVSRNSEYDPLNFQPGKSIIKIGRNNNCEVVVEDNMLSRIHCTIYFKNNVGWLIRDGFFKTADNSDDVTEVKPSTNGTWLYTYEDTPINDDMIFKSNYYLFKCSYIQS